MPRKKGGAGSHEAPSKGDIASVRAIEGAEIQCIERNSIATTFGFR